MYRAAYSDFIVGRVGGTRGVVERGAVGSSRWCDGLDALRLWVLGIMSNLFLSPHSHGVPSIGVRVLAGVPAVGPEVTQNLRKIRPIGIFGASLGLCTEIYAQIVDIGGFAGCSRVCERERNIRALSFAVRTQVHLLTKYARCVIS